MENASDAVAQEMIKTWQESLESLNDDTQKEFSKLVKQIATRTVMESVEKEAGRLLDVTTKYTGASFMTKWYWKRRFLKEKEKCDNILDKSAELVRSLKEDELWKEH